MIDDEFAERRGLSFAEAEGRVPLPSQLDLREVSPELRARLWFLVWESLKAYRHRGNAYGGYASLREPWSNILYRKHVARDHRLADDFENSFDDLAAGLKVVFERGDYVAIFDLLQWLLGQRDCPLKAYHIQSALEASRAAYRLLDDERTIVPIASDAERHTLNQAFADLAETEFQGARAHLEAAAKALTTGESAASIRESIHAVESVARALTGSDSLSGALQSLETKTKLHAALKKGFGALYGFTSDEKGIRHPLLDDATAKVDEADAIFMIGACAAFVSYLINRHRNAPGQRLSIERAAPNTKRSQTG